MIHLRGASFVYQAPDGEVEALRQVDMDIAPGEFCSVVGPSGCGKSTLLSVISGLERLTSGTVEVDDAAVCGPSDKIGLMPQRDQLFPWRTIRDNVTLGLSVLGKRTPENLAYADTLLRRYGLWDFARKRPAQLSGGMRQRVMIAMALACNPKILIADEPTTALDVTIQAQIMRLLKQLQEKMGTSIILITHDLGIVAQIAKHVMVMYCGQAVEYSDVRSIYKNPLHPYTAGLLRSIPKLTDDDMEELPSIPGMVPSPSEKLQGCRFAPRCEKCGARCKKEMPDLVTLEDGRKVRCFLYEGGVEG